MLAVKRLGELPGSRADAIAVLRHLGRLKRGFGSSAGREGFKRVRERREQFLFNQ